jgi:hypothetical protein
MPTLTELVEPWIGQMHAAFEQAMEYLQGRSLRQIEPADVRAAVRAGVPGIAFDLVDDVVGALNNRGELGQDVHHLHMLSRIAR